MYIMPSKRAGLIYPYDNDDEKRTKPVVIRTTPESRHLFGYGGEISTYGIPIPVTDSYDKFKDFMHELEPKIKLLL
jgi:hypothetical protein